MSISKAQPIQFWSVDESTYNEKEVCGIMPACWCQPFNCDGDIIIVSDDSELTPIVLNSDGVVVANGVFDVNGFWTFNPAEEGVCDGLYQIVMSDDEATALILEPSGWVDSGDDWDQNDGSDFIENGPSSNIDVVVPIKMPLVIPDGQSFIFRFILQTSGSWSGGGDTVTAVIGLTDALNQPKGASSFITIHENGSIEHNITLTVESGGIYSTDPLASLTISLIFNFSLGTVTNRFVISPGSILYFAPDTIVYKSDCLDIREDHPCTNLIEYSNNSDFAGLPYDGTSPAPIFRIRVPSVAFHESYPKEDEVQPLSNDTFRRLASTISRKVLAEFGYMPYYMHLKLNLIFMHDYIGIDDTAYVVRDPYEIVEGNKRYPLKMGRVLLTDKDFIERNLL